MPSIRLSIGGDPPVIAIHRGEGVPELFWARLSGEFDPPRATNSRMELPVERLLVNRRVLSALCRQYFVDLTADEPTRDFLARANAERAEVFRLTEEVRILEAREIADRLAGGRFTRALRPFQERDVGKLLALPHGANFSVPGAGKTTVAYCVYEAERLNGRVERMAVVAPISAFDAWQNEADECFDSVPVVHRFDPYSPTPRDAEVLLVNYSKLPNHFVAIARWIGDKACHVILDEAHRIKKGREGAWGTGSLDLAWYAARRDVLTGTPAPQHPSDLQAPLDFLWPGEARQLLPRDAFAPVPPPGTAHQIAQQIGSLFVRTRKSELDLEPPRHRVLRLDLHGLHREIYLAITNQYSGRIPASRRDRYRLAEMRQIVMYLLEAATNPALLPLGSSPDDPPIFHHPRALIASGSTLVDLLNDYGRYETPAKFRKLGEMVLANAEADRKTLVWSNFVRNLQLLRNDFRRYEPAMIHGGVPSEVSQPTAETTREAELRRFREDPDCRVLLANPAAMSEGVSLHRSCHDAIYLERTFNAGQYLQSVDRIHRLGLEPGVETRITFLVTKETVDEVVHQRVEEKAVRLGLMLDDPDIRTMALPDEQDLEDVDSGFGQPIDDDQDIAALYAHLRGEDAQ